MLSKRKAYYYMIGIFYFNIQIVISQDQRISDSLKPIYQLDKLQGIDKLELLRALSFNEINDFNLALKYANELIDLSIQSSNSVYLSYGYFQKGNSKQFIGDLNEALSAYLKSAELAGRNNLVPVEGSAYSAIADIYTISNNHKNGMLYYKKAISTLRKSSDTVALASAILNAGDALLTQKIYDSALIYFQESGKLFEKVNNTAGKAYNLGNIGIVFANNDNKELAENNINEAISILEELQDYYPISVYLMAMADIYMEKNEHTNAIKYAQRSLSLAEDYGLKEQISDANLKLSELYDHVGDSVTAYKYYKAHITYRDSLINIKTVQKLADQRTNYEVSQKQTEVDLLNQQKRNQQIILGFSALLLAALSWFFWRISKEKRKSEHLLLNILPEETADELKKNGAVKAKKYESVSVLFTDFKGFTSYSEKLSPEALVETIGFYFSKFDEIVEKHGLEKIKTIGDAYMCAGGLHTDEENHAHRMVQAGLEITAFVEETKNDQTAHERSFDIRIGINTGPVVAGVVGTKKFAYDIWGDTVNVASRMESLSEPGKINISETTYELVKDTWTCEYRGVIEVKNRGALKMYFVTA